jgi:hypothetical protein
MGLIDGIVMKIRSRLRLIEDAKSDIILCLQSGSRATNGVKPRLRPLGSARTIVLYLVEAAYRRVGRDCG